MPTSKEVYLLNNFKWLILQNVENIDYQSNVRYNHKLKAYLNTYDYEKMFFQLDDNLVQIRRLKEKYIEFNKTEERDLEKINTLLSNIIDCYSHSTLIMFKEFSELLKAHKQEIINSFIYINDNNELVICFDKYEVGPGSTGLAEFVIPKEITSKLMK